MANGLNTSKKVDPLRSLREDDGDDDVCYKCRASCRPTSSAVAPAAEPTSAHHWRAMWRGPRLAAAAMHWADYGAVPGPFPVTFDDCRRQAVSDQCVYTSKRNCPFR